MIWIVSEKIVKSLKNNKSILKSDARNNVFTKEFNNIALSANNNIRIQSIDLIETYAFGKTKDLE